MGDDDEIEWLWRQRRRAALRLVVIGMLVFVPTASWLAVYYDWGIDFWANTRLRVLGGIPAVIGALLVIAGSISLLRLRNRAVRDNGLPIAIVHQR